MGVVLALVGAGSGSPAVFVKAIAPLVAAAGVAFIYGPDNDPAIELALATPTSARQVLLARLVLVFGYDLLLALGATAGLLAVVPVDVLGTIILDWLGPMTFLSSLALVLSMRTGSGGAVSVAFILWMARWMVREITIPVAVGTDPWAATRSLALAFDTAWSSPTLLLALAAVLLLLAFWMAGRQESLLPAAS